MADDWMKLELSKPGCAKVAAIAAQLRIRETEALGGVVTVWAWAHKQTIDGRLPGILPEKIDKLTGRKGFAQAMAHKDVRWLQISDDGLTIPEWDKHNSDSAKARAQTAKRVDKYRNGSVTELTLQNHDAGVTRQTDRQTVRQELEKEKDNKQTAAVVFQSRSAEETHCLSVLLSFQDGRGGHLFDKAAAESIAKNTRCTRERLAWAANECRTRKGKVKNRAAYLRSLIEGEAGPPIKPYPSE